MYNLFVSSKPDAWEGEPWIFERGRCVDATEYTSKALAEQFGSLDREAIEKLMQFPCIFAHETGCRKDPKFGLIRDVTVRQNQGMVRVEYEILDVAPFLTESQIDDLKFELDISKWELNRTHWAIKDVELAKELHRVGIRLPEWVGNAQSAVDITSHQFEVGLSFPGEVRGLVEEIAGQLEGMIGPHTYFYDNNYVAQLARPNLDMLLQDIYANRCKLIVVFLSADYQDKEWCGIEFRAIRGIIAKRENERVMFVRTDDGAVDGVFKTDGYVDSRKYSAVDIARFISERARLIKI